MSTYLQKSSIVLELFFDKKLFEILKKDMFLFIYGPCAYLNTNMSFFEIAKPFLSKNDSISNQTFKLSLFQNMSNVRNYSFHGRFMSSIRSSWFFLSHKLTT